MSSTSTNTPTLLSVITRQIDAKMRAQGGALPGTVKSFNPATDTCVVQPGVHRIVPTIEGDFDFEELPPIYDVPVMWPQGRNFKIEGALSPGDPVLLICLDRDASAWFRTGKPSEPDDVRESSWANAVAIPGLVTAQNPFSIQTDAVALASKMDSIFRAISAIAVAASPVDAIAAVNAIVAAVKTSYPATPGVPSIATSGSTVLKVSG